MLCVWASFFKITYYLLQTRRKWTCDYNDISMTFPKLWWFKFFPGLEMTILKFHDFSRFSMTVRTLIIVLIQRLFPTWMRCVSLCNTAESRASNAPYILLCCNIQGGRSQAAHTCPRLREEAPPFTFTTSRFHLIGPKMIFPYRLTLEKRHLEL